jgi:RNase P protein component
LNQIKAGWDALFIVRRGAGSAKYQDLKNAADNLLRRADLVEKPPSPNGPGPIVDQVP